MKKPTCVQNLTTIASAAPEIWLVPNKIKVVHMTWPRLFQGWFVIRGLALATIKLPIKFELCTSTHCKDMKGNTKIESGVVWGC